MSKPTSIAQNRLLTQLSFLKDNLAEELILSEKEKNTCTILINRSEQLNALNVSMVETLVPLLKEMEESEQIHMILFQGRERAFCTGGDIKAIAHMIQYPSGRQELENLIEIYSKMVNAIGTMKKPSICFMDGLAIGSGCTICALSHFSIATENTKICLPETRFGGFCDCGANFFLTRLNSNIGKYLALTAKTLMAEDVLFSGIATHFVHSSQLPYFKESLIKLKSPNHNTINEVIEKYAVKSNHIPTSYTLRGERRKIIDRCFRFNTVAEILEDLKKEGSKFSLETINQISKGSPISVALTLEQMRRGSKLSLSQCLTMESNSWRVSPFDPDFLEGVSSTMNEKRTPRWSRSDHSTVDFEKEILDRYISANIKQALYLDGDEREHYFDTQYRGRGLPSENEVEKVKYTNSLRTNEDVIAWFVESYNNKYGVRQEVEEILNKDLYL